MHRISRLSFRAFLRSSKPIPQSYRTRCTASTTTTSDTTEGRRLMEDPSNKHLRDEYQNRAGEVIFECDPNKPLTDDEWRKFEAAFGLEDPVPPEKIREWEAMLSETEIPVKEDLPSGSVGLIMGPSDRQDGEHEKEKKVEQKVVKTRPPRRDALEDGLRQPLHRRPGYEKRVASMEAEMTRVVTEVLVERTSDWYSAGADIQRVMLSPNLRNLTVYYTVEDPPQHMGRKEWRRLNKAMAVRIHKQIFDTMDVRYAPSVFFEHVSDRNKTATETALEAAFAQIEAERLAGSTKPA